METVRRKWKTVLEEVSRSGNVVVYSCLAGSEPQRIEHGELVIGIPSSTNSELFAKRNFGVPLGQAVQKVLGVKCRVRAEAGAAPKGSPAAKPPARSAAPAAPRITSPASSRPPAPAAPPPGGTELVHDVIEVFDGRMLDDRE
jgi:hypothetical protein